MEVVFCGNSVYLCGLAGGLQQFAHIRVCLVSSLPEQLIPELKMLCPDIVIMEATGNNAGLIDCLHRANLCPVIIIVYPKTDSLAVFAGGRYFTAPLDGLVQVIEECIFRN